MGKLHNHITLHRTHPPVALHSTPPSPHHVLMYRTLWVGWFCPCDTHTGALRSHQEMAAWVALCACVCICARVCVCVCERTCLYICDTVGWFCSTIHLTQIETGYAPSHARSVGKSIQQYWDTDLRSTLHCSVRPHRIDNTGDELATIPHPILCGAIIVHPHNNGTTEERIWHWDWSWMGFVGYLYKPPCTIEILTSVTSLWKKATSYRGQARTAITPDQLTSCSTSRGTYRFTHWLFECTPCIALLAMLHLIVLQAAIPEMFTRLHFCECRLIREVCNNKVLQKLEFTWYPLWSSRDGIPRAAPPPQQQTHTCHHRLSHTLLTCLHNTCLT